MQKSVLLFFLLVAAIGCKNNSNNMQEKIQGVWIIRKAKVNPFELPDNCTINIGDAFKFDDNQLLIVNEGKNNKCSFNYFIEDSILNVTKSDISFKVKIENLKNNELTLSLKFLPQKMMANWKKEYIELKKHGFKIYLEK